MVTESEFGLPLQGKEILGGINRGRRFAPRPSSFRPLAYSGFEFAAAQRIAIVPTFRLDGGTIPSKKSRGSFQKPHIFWGKVFWNSPENRTVPFCIRKNTKKFAKSRAATACHAVARRRRVKGAEPPGPTVSESRTTPSRSGLCLPPPKMLRPCCGFVADLLRIKSLIFNRVADVADFQTSYANTQAVTMQPGGKWIRKWRCHQN